MHKPYVSVDGSYGGNQGWFDSLPNKMKSKTLQGYGCGLIAASDILSFVMSPKSEYGREDYLKYVLEMEKGFFHVLPKLGVSGILLALGMNIYFLKNRKEIKEKTGHKYHARWFVRPSVMLDRIKEMLSNDIPVLIAVGPGFFRKDKVNLYDKTEDAEGRLHFKPINKTKDHYVTVTGIIEAENCTGLGGESGPKTLLEISSWGKRYYMDYDEYRRYVKKCDNPYFSNILYIKKK